MRSITLLSFAATIAAITAFEIPAGQPYGVYQVSYGIDGTEEHTLISLNPSALPESKRHVSVRGGRQLANRDISQVVCYTTQPGLDHDNTATAAVYLENQCGFGTAVESGRDFYSTYGDTVVYFCNFKNVAQVCNSQNAISSFAIVTQNCGSSQPGSVLYSDPNGTDRYGYENYAHGGNKFCGRGK